MQVKGSRQKEHVFNFNIQINYWDKSLKAMKYHSRGLEFLFQQDCFQTA